MPTATSEYGREGFLFVAETRGMEQKSVLHVLFSPSAAGSLKFAFGQIGHSERVIGQYDDLAFGPIDGRIEERLEWLDKELAYDDYAEVLKHDAVFWAEAASQDVCPVVWINLRCAREYAGFLEFLWRVPHADFRIVDITNVVFSVGRTIIAHSLGEVAPEQIIGAQLINRQASLTPAEIENYKAAWRRLRIENAPLRIVGTEGLTSAPINYFDDEISSFVPDDWTKCARVIGEVLRKQCADPFRQTDDMLLWSRLRKLCEAGAFESRGDLSEMRHSEVRRNTRRG